MATCPSCHHSFPGASFCPEDGVRLQAPEPPLYAGRFRLVRRVGQGGMGVVFEAEHAFIQKKVALKLLHDDLAGNREAVLRLQREAHATSGIGHPNIVRIEDFGHDEHGQVYLAMEWLDGETLEQRLTRGPVGEAETLELTVQIAAGLAAAHAQGVIHRDLKPANVFLARDERGRRVVKVIDFGLARLLLPDEGLTLSGRGMLAGTPYYVAPEQALGESVDARADVYALGVLLYQLATGGVPFRADSIIGVLQQQVTTPPEPPRQRAPDREISVELEAIVLRCLAKAAGDRFQSMDALGAALERLRPRPTLDARVTARTPPVRRQLGPWLSVAAMVTGLSLAAVQLAPMWRTEPRAPAARPAVAEARPALVERPAPPAPTPSPPPVEATPPLPAPAPVPAPIEDVRTWQYHQGAEHFALDVEVAPRPIRAGLGATYQLTIVATDAALAEALAAGRVQAELTFLHWREHHKTVNAHADVDQDGHVRLDALLAREGKHHVMITLTDGDARLGSATFDVCVGADPDGPAEQLAPICPRLNAAAGAPRSAHAEVHATH